MRINRLDLTRYGRFTDHSFDFGSALSGKPDLHIIYGPNEAGKSTTFSAILDLLFGIEHKSRYNFLHPYPAMRLGASMQVSGTSHELVRTKARLNSLQDADGRPLSDSLITDELGDIDREAYRTMFSLDDLTLEQGGESILQSKGNLGELLFSASAGLADLSQSLGRMRTDAELFYRPGARSGELADLKTQLQALEAQKTELDAKTSAAAFARLAAEHDTANKAYQQAMREHLVTRNRISEIKDLLGTMPRLQHWQELQDRLRDYDDLPHSPSGWDSELPQLEREDVSLRTKAQSYMDEIHALSAELDGLQINQQALHQAAALEQLSNLRARFITAEKDLPERRLQARDKQQVIETLLARLDRSGEPAPRNLLLKAQTEAELRALIESRSGIEAELNAANQELAKARHRLTRAQEKHPHIDAHAVTDTAALSMRALLPAQLKQLRQSDYLTRLRLTEATVREEAALLDEAMLQLRPWDGTLKDLLTLNVPLVKSLEQWRTQMQEMLTRQIRYQQMLEEQQGEASRLAAELLAVQQGEALITSDQARVLRGERDAAWQQHLGMMQSATATQFADLMQRDDRISEQRLLQAESGARFMQMQQRQAVVQAEILRLQALIAAHEPEIAILNSKMLGWMREVFNHADYAGDTDPGAQHADIMLRWLEKREQILKIYHQGQRSQRQVQEAQRDIDAARDTLLVSLQQIGAQPDHDLNYQVLLSQAEYLAEQLQTEQAMQADFAERRQDIIEREADYTTATAADQLWQKTWAKICATTWFGKSEQPALPAVREIIDLTTALGPALDQYEMLQERIDKMVQDQADFRAEIQTLAAGLNMAVVDEAGAPVPVLTMAARMTTEIDLAVQQQRQAANLNDRLEKLRLNAQANSQGLTATDQRIAMMTAHFGVGSLRDVDEKLQQNREKIQLQQAVEREQQAIISALQVTTLEAAQQKLQAADPQELHEEMQELQLSDEAQDQRKQDAYSLLKQAETALHSAEGTDAQAALLDEQHQTLLLEIEERSQNYLRLRFGISAAEHALRLYRDQHRSTMMARASSAFAAISQGAYRQLTAQADKDNETLIAIAADGSSKTAEELSKGTRFQLYLALRMAGYYEFVQAQKPMPFIADDIMETFDDARARETLTLFAEMAKHGQVIYLTHHQHLCDIAREACPEAQFHQLDPRQIAA